MVHIDFYKYEHMSRVGKTRCSRDCELHFDVNVYDNIDKIVGHDDTKDNPIKYNDQTDTYDFFKELTMDFPFNNYGVSYFISLEINTIII